ncbi:hypothetical protein [Rhodanobacter sp. DHB23]|uniref:hypothetical protein n=1 Tax=Rhodanobacter sp. DHB23 TaxID=2775923 RepID=UPI00177B586B|nr:hypothetical protein [Rhodanobacter sp. DHB23]MBD8872590.1 hypothetical protein [Rhodanobacter sp. DHB23]
MPKSSPLIAALLASALVAASTWAIAQQPIALPDFNGLWRLNDTGSDSPEQVTAMLRAELRHEQSPSVAPASASSSGNSSQQGIHSGHSGGRGGMGGGHSGGMGGGGHGHGGGKADASSTSADSFSDDDMLKLPPTLANDAVLIVQQDADALQARLENGEQLAVPVSGRDRHTLDGNAIAHRQDAGQDLRFSLQFNDGSHLDETWSRSADGHALQVTEQWQPGFLQRPVVFHRNYVRIDQ